MTTYAEVRPSYITDAFYVQYNVILLGGAGLFSLAAASPLPLGCGLILEALYLLIAPNLAAFRRYSDARYAAVEIEASDLSVPTGIAPDLAQGSRVAGFSRALSDVQARLRTPQAMPLALALDRLEGAAAKFGRLCDLEQRVGRVLATSTQADLETELARLQAECEVEPDAMQKVSLRLAQNNVKRRLAQRQEAVAKQHTIQLKLERIEQAMLQAPVSGGQELQQRLDRVAVELSALEELERDSENLAH